MTHNRKLDAQLAGASERLYEMQAELCRVLGHPRRLQILDILSNNERSAGELLQLLGVSKVNLSQHLGVMKHVGLVESRQQGRQVFYRLAFAEIRGACQMIRHVLSARLNQGTQLAKNLSGQASVEIAGDERSAGRK